MSTSDEELLVEVDEVIILDTKISLATFANQLNNKLGLTNSQKRRETEAATFNTNNRSQLRIYYFKQQQYKFTISFLPSLKVRISLKIKKLLIQENLLELESM